MKPLLIIIFLCILPMVCVLAQPLDGAYVKVTQSSDEFNSTSMNTTLWQYNWQTYQEYTVYNPSNVLYGKNPSISVGANNYVCKIISKYVIPAQSGVYWDASTNSVATKSSNIICGQILSTQSFKYGYYEVKMKEPNSIVGICSSFWFFGADATGVGEIDVQENQSDNTSITVPPTSNTPAKSNLRNAIQFHYTGDNDCWPYGKNMLIRDNNNNLVDLSQAFHTYGLNWQPDYIDFYCDGILKTHFTRDNFHYPNPQGATLPVSKIPPLKVILWTKAGNSAIPPSTNGDCALEIDYFRYYRNKPVIVSSKINFAGKTADLTFTNGLPDTYSFSTGTPLGQSGNNATVRLSPSEDNTNLTIGLSFTNPSGSITIPMNIWFVNGTADVCYYTNSNDVVIANTINAPLKPCSYPPIYYKSQNISYIARDAITLDAGFEVQLGATFYGEVKGQ